MKIKRSTLLLWKKIVIRVGVFMVVVGSVCGYFLTNFFTVTHYVMTGIPDEYRDSIEIKARESEAKKQFFFIPSNKVLTYNVGALRSAIIKTLPNTKAVSIRPAGLHTMSIAVTTFVPLFRIDDTYAITKDGVVYKEIQDISALPIFTVASSTTRAVTKDGVFSKEILGLPQEFLVKFASLVERVQPVLFPVRSIFLDKEGDVTFLNENGSSFIKFSSASDADKVWSNLVSAVDTEPLKSKLEKNKADLLYLDVRFGNKVFYKFAHDTFTKPSVTAIIGNNDATSTLSTQPTSTLSE
jgi:hypothetical protein